MLGLFTQCSAESKTACGHLSTSTSHKETNEFQVHHFCVNSRDHFSVVNPLPELWSSRDIDIFSVSETVGMICRLFRILSTKWDLVADKKDSFLPPDLPLPVHTNILQNHSFVVFTILHYLLPPYQAFIYLLIFIMIC